MDALRVFAIFAVIFLHTFVGQSANIGSTAFFVLNIYRSMVVFAVPMFFMISGALFLNPKKEITIKRIFLKNISHIIVAFVFWFILYETFFYLYNRENYLSWYRRGFSHFWFLVVLIGLYVLTPIFRCVTQNRRTTEYFLCICAVAVFIIPHVDIWNITLGSYIDLVFPFSFYFVMGHYLANYTLPKEIRIAIYIFGVMCIILTASLTAFLSIHRGEIVETFYQSLFIFAAGQTIAIFLFFKTRNVQSPLFTKLSRYVFGIYLVHHSFIYILERYSLLNYVFYMPLIAVAVFCLGFCITFVISKIPILRKWII